MRSCVRRVAERGRRDARASFSNFRQAANDLVHPVMASSTSAGLARPIFRLNCSTDSVRIWLIFTQDFLGRFAASSSSVRGNPARCGWLVSAIAITVPERWLKMSLLNTIPGVGRPARVPGSVENCRINVASQYLGDAEISAVSPSSAIACSDLRSSLAHSRASALLSMRLIFSDTAS